MSMLKEAILDAQELQKASVLHAQKLVSEKYNDKIRNAVEKILMEAEEPASDGKDDGLDLSGLDEAVGGMDEPADLAEDTSMAGSAATASPVKDKLPNSHKSDDDLVEIDLQKLEEMISRELQEMSSGEAEDEMVDRKDVLEEVAEPSDSEEPITEEKEEADEEPLEETLEVAAKCTDKDDCICESCTSKRELEESLNYLAETLSKYKKKLAETREKNTLLEKKNSEYRKFLLEQNLNNAKLIFQNKVLLDESLTSSQKKVLVENINKSDSVEKAKTIYELRKTTATGTKKPQSLHETLGRSTMSVNGSTKVNEPKIDPVFKRMQELARIK